MCVFTRKDPLHHEVRVWENLTSHSPTAGGLWTELIRMEATLHHLKSPVGKILPVLM